jgi:ElaB/YqjD/DUF883 family membrane-anchored ribosome-binding protein
MQEILSRYPVQSEASQVRVEIERAREELSRSALALKDEMAATVDWRGWVQEHPWTFVLGAVGVGLVLGSRRAR